MYSKILYPSGYIKSLKSDEYNNLYSSLFLRKMCGTTQLYKKACENEIFIAKRIIKYNFKNVVKIYKITDKFTPQFICPTELDSDGVYDRVKSDKTEPCFVEK